MEKLFSTKKITLSTLKAFAKRNKNNLFVKETSSFDGMVDCVMPNQKTKWSKTKYDPAKKGYYRTGIDGVYTVGGSRDYIVMFEEDEFIGLRVSNCYGCSYLATKKEPEYIDFEKELFQ